MNEQTVRKGDIGGLVLSLFFAIAGAVTLYDTTGYGDIDSASFPRAIAIALIALSIISAIRSVMMATPSAPLPGSNVRRIALPVVMIALVVTMPAVGFLPPAIILFILLGAIAHFGHWTGRQIVIHLLASLVIVGGFYALFRFVLQVPLP